MPPISDAALEAARHMGYTQTPPQEAANAWLSPSGYIINEADLPRPDEDHGDALRYLLFLIRKGFLVVFVGDEPQVTLVRRGDPDRMFHGTGDNVIQSFCAACNAAMRAVAAESEGEA